MKSFFASWDGAALMLQHALAQRADEGFIFSDALRAEVQAASQLESEAGCFETGRSIAARLGGLTRRADYP